MIRVVLDTNVLLSGTFWTGASYRILEWVDKGKIVLILSDSIFEEYNRIVRSGKILDKKAYNPERVESIMKLLQKALFVQPEEKLKVVKEDPDDDKFLEAAIAGRADFIISRDNHLLKLQRYKKIKILTPDEFLSLRK